MTPHRLRGFYAITSERICTSEKTLLAAVDSALRGGAALIQYRDKTSPRDAREQNARALLALCRAHQRPLIINDDVALCARIGADGVHLGLNDILVADARHLLGRDALIGATCGNDLACAFSASAHSADYVAFGAFFPSRTKPQAPPAELETLRRVRLLLHPQLPICAIGGVTPDNAPALMAAGANLIAAVGGVFDAPDIEAAARRYSQLFE